MNIKLVEDFKNDTEIKINEKWQSLPVETISALSVMNFLREQEKLINEQIDKAFNELEGLTDNVKLYNTTHPNVQMQNVYDTAKQIKEDEILMSGDYIKRPDYEMAKNNIIRYLKNHLVPFTEEYAINRAEVILDALGITPKDTGKDEG